MTQEEFFRYCESEFAKFDTMEKIVTEAETEYVERTGAMNPEISKTDLRKRNEAILGSLNINSQAVTNLLLNFQFRLSL